MVAMLLFCAILVIWIAYVLWSDHRIMTQYRTRNDAMELQKSRFPSASEDDIQRFLDCLGEAFGFRENLRTKFQPDDPLFGIYRSLYGEKTPRADALECELFIDLLSTEFQVPIDRILSHCHEKVTLEECFALTQKAKATKFPSIGGVAGERLTGWWRVRE